MSTERNPDSAVSPLDEVIAAYLKAAETGVEPDRTEWLRRHPDLARELSEFFADQDNFENAVQPQTVTLPANGVHPVHSIHDFHPTDFGDYEIFSEIARGGMGVVYKARQKSLNRIVALKMILR